VGQLPPGQSVLEIWGLVVMILPNRKRAVRLGRRG
jgi:hypothetical protein